MKRTGSGDALITVMTSATCGVATNKQGELVVDGNIYVDMLTKIYMVEKA
jgi:hypothetical protein